MIGWQELYKGFSWRSELLRMWAMKLISMTPWLLSVSTSRRRRTPARWRRWWRWSWLFLSAWTSMVFYFLFMVIAFIVSTLLRVVSVSMIWHISNFNVQRTVFRIPALKFIFAFSHYICFLIYQGRFCTVGFFLLVDYKPAIVFLVFLFKSDISYNYSPCWLL